MPQPDFETLLLHHIDALEDADETCREAADARRVVLQAATKAGLDTGLLKMVTRARRLDQAVLGQLRRYQEIAFSFMETDLGRAASAARKTEPEEEAELYEEEEEEEEKEGV